jgi:transcriptional regulator with XRE-family HTH domain
MNLRENKLTQLETAQQLGVSHPTIIKIENGEISTVKYKTVEAYANLFGYYIHYLQQKSIKLK